MLDPLGIRVTSPTRRKTFKRHCLTISLPGFHQNFSITWLITRKISCYWATDHSCSLPPLSRAGEPASSHGASDSLKDPWPLGLCSNQLQLPHHPSAPRGQSHIAPLPQQWALWGSWQLLFFGPQVTSSFKGSGSTSPMWLMPLFGPKHQLTDSGPPA